MARLDSPHAAPAQAHAQAPALAPPPSPLGHGHSWPFRAHPTPSPAQPDTPSWPRISTIIASYNNGPQIETAIRSVLLQDYPNSELIVIDGASSDTTPGILQHYARSLAYCQSAPDSGIYDAMNQGLARASGDFIYFLGCDDMLMHSRVFRSLFADPCNRSAHLLYGDVLFVNRRMRYGGPFTYDRMLRENRNICQQAIFYSRHIFDQIGTYNLQYKILADFDLNLRIFSDPSFTIRYLDQIIALYYDDGLSSRAVDAPFMDAFIAGHVSRHWDFRQLYFDYVAQGFELRRLQHVPFRAFIQRFYALRHWFLSRFRPDERNH